MPIFCQFKLFCPVHLLHLKILEHGQKILDVFKNFKIFERVSFPEILSISKMTGNGKKNFWICPKIFAHVQKFLDGAWVFIYLKNVDFHALLPPWKIHLNLWLVKVQYILVKWKTVSLKMCCEKFRFQDSMISSSLF